MPQLHYSASISDAGGHRKTVVAYSNPADLANTLTGFSAWIAALDAIISGIIVAGEIRITPDLTGVATSSRSGFADSRVNEGGGFEFSLSGTQKHYSQVVPAIKDTLVNTKGAPILTATAIGSYTTLMLGTSAAFTEEKGIATLASVYGAFESNRKISGLKGSTFTTS